MTARSSDIAWSAIIGGGLAYTLYAIFFDKELLSMAAARYRRAHPLLWRLFAGTVLTHLMGMPPPIDLFSEHNIIHKLYVKLWYKHTRLAVAPPWCRYMGNIIRERDTA